MNRSRVFLIQDTLAHYRLPFFRALCSLGGLELTVSFHRDETQLPSAAALEDEPFETIVIQGLGLFPPARMVWHAGVLNRINKQYADLIIAGLDLRILSNIVACLVARVRGLPFIWWGHGLSPRSSWLSTWLRLRLIGLASAVILYDESMRQKLAARGAPGAKLFVALNTVDVAEISRWRADTPFRGRFRILYVGRLIPAKKVTLLIRGFALAVERLEPNLQLTIVGDGPEESAIKTLIGELRLEGNVELVGGLYSEHELAQYFNTSLLYVSPGYIGLAAVQSLAYGVPLLVARSEPHSPEISAVQDGHNGIMFESDSPSKLAGTLIAVLNDKASWYRLHEAAINTADECYNVQTMVRGFEEALHYALSKPDE